VVVEAVEDASETASAPRAFDVVVEAVEDASETASAPTVVRTVPATGTTTSDHCDHNA
jgi:hypothetical protein